MSPLKIVLCLFVYFAAGYLMRYAQEIIGGNKMKLLGASDLLTMIEEGTDFYNPELELYCFIYNNEGAICFYHITEDEADKLANESDGEYWGASLGAGGQVFDEPYPYLKAIWNKGEWIPTDDWEVRV